MAKFFGVGRTFARGKGGIPARLEDAELIRDSVFQIIGTRPGERVFRPEFGTRVKDLLFESTGPVLQALIKREVERALRKFEPRIKVLSVITTSDNDTSLIVAVEYRVFDIEDAVTVVVGGGNV